MAGRSAPTQSGARTSPARRPSVGRIRDEQPKSAWPLSRGWTLVLIGLAVAVRPSAGPLCPGRRLRGAVHHAHRAGRGGRRDRTAATHRSRPYDPDRSPGFGSGWFHGRARALRSRLRSSGLDHTGGRSASRRRRFVRSGYRRRRGDRLGGPAGGRGSSERRRAARYLGQLSHRVRGCRRTRSRTCRSQARRHDRGIFDAAAIRGRRP